MIESGARGAQLGALSPVDLVAQIGFAIADTKLGRLVLTLPDPAQPTQDSLHPIGAERGAHHTMIANRCLAAVTAPFAPVTGRRASAVSSAC